MKRILIITGGALIWAFVLAGQSLLLLMSGNGGGGGGGTTWTSVQKATAVNEACNPTCTLSVSSTGTGNLLVLEYVSSGVGSNYLTNISSVTGGGTWVAGGACHAQDTASSQGTDIAYVLSSSSGTTSLSITLSTNESLGMFLFKEYHRTSGTTSLDGSCQSLNTQSPSANPVTACTRTYRG